MAVLADNGVVTLLDVLGEMDRDGKAYEIAEVLTQSNEFMQDMAVVEGNTVTGNKDAVRTSLPEPSFRAINEGVPKTKGASTPIEETAAMLEDFSEVDRELAILSGNVDAYRLRQGKPHILGMGHKMAETIFYGNARVSPKEFTGLAPRFNTLDDTASEAAGQVIDAGGTGSDLRSAYLINWSPDTVFGFYPKNTKGGLDHEDVTNASGAGEHGFPAATVLQDASGNMYMGYRDHWIWRMGLMVKDWREVIRIANIDLSQITVDGATGPDLQDLFVQAQELIQGAPGGRMAFYVPREIRSLFRRQLLNKKNAFLSWDDMAGKKVMMFGETPVRRVDALNTAEEEVTA
jgi:hypothetical protein